MDPEANSDVFFLMDEKFDFNVSLSPASSNGEDCEDEVFVGPVGHKERCISSKVSSRLQNVRTTSWSPLSGDQLEAICEEAQKVANQLQSSEHAQKDTDIENTDPNSEKNNFVQDSEAKLSMFCNPPTVLSPIKRETFCIQDSPLKQLPPAIQSRLMKGRSPKPNNQAIKSTIRPTGKAQPNQHATRSTTSVPKSLSSPVSVSKTQSRPALRGKTGLGVSVVLPSRPTAPASSRSTTKNQADKSRLQPPSKVSSGWRRSPNSSRNGSCEDLLSDSASVTSDVSDTSLNSSNLGRRSLAPPTKSVRTRAGVKAPDSSRHLTDRRKTSSSSSSVSSFNSSISLSPAPKVSGKSKNSSLTSGPAPHSVTKLTNQKHRRSVSCKSSDPPLAGRRSLSVQNRKPSQPELHKPPRTTPLRHASPGPNTPIGKGLTRTSSVPSVRLQSGAKTKPQALVPPTPNGTLRGSCSPDATKMLKPKRLVSTKSVDSVPQKPCLSTLTPSGGSSSALQIKARRPSALPTPIRSRLSGIPQPTPSSQLRPIRPLHSHCAPNSLTPTESPDSVDVPLVQPFNLEEEEPEQAPPTVTPPDQSQTIKITHFNLSQSTKTVQSDQSETTSPESTSQSESSREPHQEMTLETITKTQEILLLDLPAPALQPQEKLLIDLTNTPDLIRTKNCPSAAELIDLSSPLIKWSPVDKKEKEAPLINLSF